ncbi:FG-GAP repeat domain-containing protein [Streptomyces zhihengii]|uniref:FG-GAP repeat domain-containing protein n=1 Tax=Streptomyces zhihengii TaxID=1818004 RepID=UPI0033BE4F2B
MPRTRTARRLAAAVSTVLAVTLGAGGMSAPALAASPVSAVAAPAEAGAGARATADEGVSPFPTGFRLTGATATGYLVRSETSLEHRWVSAADGEHTTLASSSAVSATGIGDLVVDRAPNAAVLRDLAAGTQLLRVAFPVGSGISYAGGAGRTIFTTVVDEGGRTVLRGHGVDGVVTPLTGLPAGATAIAVGAATPEHALVTFTAASGERTWGFVDLAASTVSVHGPIPPAGLKGDVAVSRTHLAWVEEEGSKGSVVVVTRATGTTQRIPLGASAYNIEIGLAGDWLTYGERGGHTAGTPDAMHALTARHLTNGTVRRLLDHVNSAATGPDGSLYVRGGTVAKGEGVYRVAPPAAGGAPSEELVATTGESTALSLRGHDIGSVIDLDAPHGQRALTWRLSRHNADLTGTLRHVRTGKTMRFSVTHPYTPDYTFPWQGDLGFDERVSAYNGEYTWEFTARPLNGIGPDLKASGRFTVTRAPSAHDFTDNGAPDLLARDAGGRLWRLDTDYWAFADQLDGTDRALVGGGWNTYDLIESAGDLAGARTDDLVARDRSGVLWLYLGKGDGTFTARTRVGGGWGGYTSVAAGGDLTGDGRADLVASDASGVLWLHRGTGDRSAPFAARTRVGGGWGIYDSLTLAGDLAGAKAGDLLARDRSGVLWLYLGKGDGTFTARTRVGGGWGAMPQLVAIGDADRDGRADLLTVGSDGRKWLYKGTGDRAVPFRQRSLANLVLPEWDGNHLV